MYHVNPIVDVIPLCQGCLGCCSYCKTVQSRGRLISFPKEQILERVKKALAAENIRELWFTGEDTLAWGLEKKEHFGILF